MKFQKLTTNVMVEDVGRTVSFYREILGFEFVMAVPENSHEVTTMWNKDQVLDYALMRFEDVEILFQSRNSLSEVLPVLRDAEIGGSLVFYFQVEDIKELYAKMSDRVTILKDMQTTFYGMEEFYIGDCNGYILGFAEAV